MNTSKKISKKNIAKKSSSKKSITPELANKIRRENTQDWIYVSPVDNIWTLRKSGSGRALRSYKLKASALNAAKRITQSITGSRIIIYNSKGEISKIIK
jgi:hypothetical protein